MSKDTELQQGDVPSTVIPVPNIIPLATETKDGFSTREQPPDGIEKDIINPNHWKILPWISKIACIGTPGAGIVAKALMQGAQNKGLSPSITYDPNTGKLNLNVPKESIKYFVAPMVIPNGIAAWPFMFAYDTIKDKITKNDEPQQLITWAIKFKDAGTMEYNLGDFQIPSNSYLAFSSAFDQDGNQVIDPTTAYAIPADTFENMYQPAIEQFYMPEYTDADYEQAMQGINPMGIEHNAIAALPEADTPGYDFEANEDNMQL